MVVYVLDGLTHGFDIGCSGPFTFCTPHNLPDFSVTYSSFDNSGGLVRILGKNCLLSKIDIRHAFQSCPVRQCDCQLLGTNWQDMYFIDTRLPLGSQLPPCIFNCLADLLARILIYYFGIPFVMHYLDDFLLAYPHDSPKI